jgi:hypothetical protein
LVQDVNNNPICNELRTALNAARGVAARLCEATGESSDTFVLFGVLELLAFRANEE